MFIREALESDLEGIADCAERFFQYAKYKEKGLTLDRESFKEMVKEYIKSLEGVVLLLMDDLKVVGGICGTTSPWGFNKHIKIGLELFYWVDEKYRGKDSLKLFKMYETIMKSLGVQVNFMMSVESDLQFQVNRLYQRKGYQNLESFFTKIL